MWKMAKLDVIAGFLGAGKTTFISHYIAWLTTQNIKYAVIENEFGVAGIDAETLREKGAKVKEISGGCICCTMQVSLHSLLSELSQEVDRIILEPSGLFNGDDFIGILQNPTLKSSLRKGMWLGVVDPLALPLFSEPEVEVLADELIFAGSVLISKTRLADETRIAAAVRSIENMVPAPKPLIFTADWESYTPDIWFPQLQHSGFQTRPHERKAINHRLLYESARLLLRRIQRRPVARGRGRHHEVGRRGDFTNQRICLLQKRWHLRAQLHARKCVDPTVGRAVQACAEYHRTRSGSRKNQENVSTLIHPIF